MKKQFEAISTAARKSDTATFNSLVDSLRIPDDSGWFDTAFGEEMGQKLADQYRSSWPAYSDVVDRSFQEFRHGRALQITVRDVSTEPGDQMMRAVTAAAKIPLSFYTASVSPNDRGISMLPGIYVYVEGSFRVLNWATLYKLPNVQPMRIRVRGAVAAASLIRQVQPVYPDEAKRDHIHGTLVLHAIVDRDGFTSQWEYVSGPKELLQSAIDALKQWRYKPTLLNGDPVEVDTTISIVYKLGR